MANPNYANRIYLYTLAASLPSLIIATYLLWQIELSPYGKTFISLLLLISAIGFSFAIKSQINFQFQTLTNLVEAIRCGDFSLRGTRSKSDDPLSELVAQINLLSDALLEQRLASEEAFRLLDKAISEINVAVFAFDGQQRIKLANPAASRLMAQPLDNLIGQSAQSLALDGYLELSKNSLIEQSFPGASGRWQIRSDSFREHGVQRKLLFINDLRQVLREEEINAWKNLMRVVSHEVNNSLFPIKSLGQTLKSMINQPEKDDDWLEDVNDGLDIITDRAEQLSDFVKRYAKVAKMPTPNKVAVTLDTVLSKVTQLYPSQVQINVEHSVLQTEIFADLSMLEQLLINLIKNGLEAGNEVVLDAIRIEKRLTVSIWDNGPGVSNPTNLFVPFYTTKKHGSGIGLIVCRQIVEAHDGLITIDNHPNGGCIVEVTLPCIEQEIH